MFSHRLAESLLWLQLWGSSVIDSSQQRKGVNKSPSRHSDWLLMGRQNAHWKRERAGWEGNRAFPNFKQRGGGIVKRKRHLEGEKEVKKREMRWRGRDKRRERSRRKRRGWEEEVKRWRWSGGAHLNKWFSCRGGGAQEAFFLSFVQQEAPASLYFSSQEENWRQYRGAPPHHRLHVWVCSFLPASLFFSVWLKRGSGLLMCFLRHTVQGFSSVAATVAAAPERCVRCPVWAQMLRESAESAVGVGPFLNVLSCCFPADTHTVWCVCGEQPGENSSGSLLSSVCVETRIWWFWWDGSVRFTCDRQDFFSALLEQSDWNAADLMYRQSQRSVKSTCRVWSSSTASVGDPPNTPSWLVSTASPHQDACGRARCAQSGVGETRRKQTHSGIPGHLDPDLWNHWPSQTCWVKRRMDSSTDRAARRR